MAEIIQRDGVWAFDGDALRLTPGRDRNVSVLRRTLDELAVPLGALAGISFERGRRRGRLRLRLRDGADPLLHATGGRLAAPHDPYQLTVEPARYGVAEYVTDEVREALLLARVPSTPVREYLLPGPPLPLSVSAGDGTASFDGARVRLEWNWKTEGTKAAAGPRTLALADILGVEWQPSAGLASGCLRFRVAGAPAVERAAYDPNAVELWGFKRDPLTALVAAAVQARLPHPAAAVPVPESAQDPETAPAPRASQRPETARRPEAAREPEAAEAEHDALLRRLRRLGELRRAGVLTDEEFTTAKQAVLKRM
ncbi:DUF4429 domain-containing protein [Streptomyces shenzhenensis]|uniref:DUF4429 domain-containing protein n=1 Tax=Streptomyces shenzhenensis TaxID=943815 RepID=UPI0015F030E0|nr:DUF4429 domain-containing protein [Streptomyces shenzhenensis]